jgi:hypothetical protein
MALEGDSGEYEFLTEAVRLSAHIDAPTVEIGVRMGMGSKTMMDAIVEYCPGKTHIGIDPYGSILYEMKENVEPCRLDYTNDMYKQCMVDLFTHIIGKPVEFVHFKMTDIDYFGRFKNYVSLYDIEYWSMVKYSCVHFDGPHTHLSVMNEVRFFNDRTESGATFVFDDIGIDDFFYTHSRVHDWLLNHGWECLKTGVKKALYQKR